jgi:DNA repair exonuclease SbcCD ATPase subunit
MPLKINDMLDKILEMAGKVQTKIEIQEEELKEAKDKIYKLEQKKYLSQPDGKFGGFGSDSVPIVEKELAEPAQELKQCRERIRELELSKQKSDKVQAEIQAQSIRLGEEVGRLVSMIRRKDAQIHAFTNQLQSEKKMKEEIEKLQRQNFNYREERIHNLFLKEYVSAIFKFVSNKQGLRQEFETAFFKLQPQAGVNYENVYRKTFDTIQQSDELMEYIRRRNSGIIPSVIPNYCKLSLY